ncbi:MAG TPA: lipopolysaccharide transport periplasmic protein LptA [Rhizomicrobium sp.]
MTLRSAAMFGATIFLVSLSAAAAAPAPAAQGTSTTSVGMSKHDTSAPINVSSDNFQGDTQTKIGTYIGNVIIIQGDFKLRADKVNVHVVNGKPSTLDGAGNVLFTSQTETASGDTGIYDLNAKTITLDGKVVLTSKEKNVMRGTHLVMNMDTHKALLTAKGMAGGGRVQALFVPPPKSESDKPKSQTTGKPPAK